MAYRRWVSHAGRNNCSVQGGEKEIIEISAKNPPLAHIGEDGQKHLLYDHLTWTAKLAADFASEFGCREWGQINTIVTVKWL